MHEEPKPCNLATPNVNALVTELGLLGTDTRAAAPLLPMFSVFTSAASTAEALHVDLCQSETVSRAIQNFFHAEDGVGFDGTSDDLGSKLCASGAVSYGDGARDPLVRIARAYLRSASAFQRAATADACVWSTDYPFDTVSAYNCPNADLVRSELLSAAHEPAALGRVGHMPDVATSSSGSSGSCAWLAASKDSGSSRPAVR